MEKEIKEDVIEDKKSKGNFGLIFCKVLTAIIVISWLILLIITFVMMVMGSITAASVAQLPGIGTALVVGNFVGIFLISFVSGLVALLLILAIWGIYYFVGLCKNSFNNRGHKQEYKDKLNKQSIEVKEINRISEDEIKKQEEDLFK